MNISGIGESLEEGSEQEAQDWQGAGWEEGMGTMSKFLFEKFPYTSVQTTPAKVVA